MSSIVSGYEYDIFISYRQKDNKGERWVSEFVEALKTELDSAFKEEIGLYFDVNPHDGLLETHDVDASLKDKLKCLVFIPVLSRTYCDPASFAWEHEFRAFIGLASKDNFGLKVKMPNGNVTSRILPVFIHDLDEEDKKLVEQELGGFIRGINFIYEEPGVNRPLTSRDKEGKNANKASYRNQVNKVANAIRDILTAIKTTSQNRNSAAEKALLETDLEDTHNENLVPGQSITPLSSAHSKKTGKLLYRNIATYLGIVIILAFLGIYSWPKIFHPHAPDSRTTGDQKISVVVMPFQNLTNDTTLNIWQVGIQDNLITSLSNNPEEIGVKQSEFVNSLIKGKNIANYADLTTLISSDISLKFEAGMFISGSIKKQGETLRLNAQLIDSKTKEVSKSFQKEGDSRMILTVIDSLSIQIRNYILLTLLKKEEKHGTPLATNSPEAFRYYILGQNARDIYDIKKAAHWCELALKADSNFTSAMRLISVVYNELGKTKEAKEWARKSHSMKARMTPVEQTIADFYYAQFFGTPNEEINALRAWQKLDNQNPVINFNLGMRYRNSNQDKAIIEFSKALEMFNKWGIKPIKSMYYVHLGALYHKTGQYQLEEKIYIKAEKDFPDDYPLISRQIIFTLSKRDTASTNRLIEKLEPILKENYLFSDAHLAFYMGEYIYLPAKDFEKAEKYYRKALSLEPQSTRRMNSLAYFLINNNRNVKEGLDLANKAVEKYPDNFEYLRTRGWGYYKLGKYREALEILEKSWKLRLENSRYDTQAFNELEIVRKAVSGMN